MLGHHVKFLKLWVPKICTVDLVAGTGPCSPLASQYPVELCISAEQRLSKGCWLGDVVIPYSLLGHVSICYVSHMCSLINHGYWGPCAKPQYPFGRETSLKPSWATILAHQNCLTVMTAGFLFFCGRSNEMHQSIW